MKDYIKELCKELEINVVYTNNKRTVLSSSFQRDNPILRIHKIFKNCTKKIAEAVISYYTDQHNRNDNLDKIHTFLNTNFSSKDYKIIAPCNTLKINVNEETSPKALDKYKKTELAEFQIKKIIKDNFFGGESEISPDEAIRSSSEDVVGLDIIVDFIEKEVNQWAGS